MLHAADASLPLALLVVTDPLLRERCREQLCAAGLSVVSEIEGGAAAVTAARERHPKVIVLSRQLGDVAASEATRWLHANRESAATPIIVIGGKPAPSAAKGLVSVLPRSFTAAQFRETLAAAMQATAAGKTTSPSHNATGR